MPTYVYECRKCEKVIEVDQKMSDPPLKDCACGSTGTLVRLIQPTAVMFKGNGFHINDYSPKPPAETTTPCSTDCACAKDPDSP